MMSLNSKPLCQLDELE